jgi:hypothetical protein
MSKRNKKKEKSSIDDAQRQRKRHTAPILF